MGRIITKTIIIEDIEINITKKKIKNINLSVRAPNGEVRVSAPLKTTDKVIKELVISKLPWIKKHQARFKDQEKAIKNKYVSGESLILFGEEYKINLIYIDKNPATVELRDEGYVDLYVKEEMTKEQRAKVLKEWKRQELKRRIPPLIEKWEKTMGVEVEAFGVKQMKTRWGTCNVVARRIWINLELAKKSPACLEYIVVHEMVHLLERSHNDKFKAYMDQFLPNWKTIKAELNNIN
ncbi:MAG TPA: M48 family metallopeptidase [Epulopiscium sp.]|nr:M48 family metallopeptidase [Candidatus Epulonipiscium sp.]